MFPAREGRKHSTKSTESPYAKIEHRFCAHAFDLILSLQRSSAHVYNHVPITYFTQMSLRWSRQIIRARLTDCILLQYFRGGLIRCWDVKYNNPVFIQLEMDEIISVQ